MVETTCIGCGLATTKPVIDLGPQPPSNRFLKRRDERCETHVLRFGYCPACGLAQLSDPMSVETVRSRYAWITYNEPESHLDNLVDSLVRVAGLDRDTRITGVTYKDDSTLARFRSRGVTNLARLDQARDLEIADPLASLETVQERLTADRAAAIAGRGHRADIVIARHVLEHAHRPSQLLAACERLAKPGGWLVFEVPDERKVFEGHDHCFLWEEHIAYFTPATLKAFLDASGFLDARLDVVPYPLESSIIAIVRNVRTAPRSPGAMDGESGRVESFGASLAERATKVRKYLRSLQAENKKVAVFGAGHLAAKFINFYQLAPLIVAVIDDKSNKQKLFMPGSAVPIVDSSWLDEGRVDVCLLTLNPESEQKVLRAKAGYTGRGGQFRCIFSDGSNSIDLELEGDRTRAHQ